MKVLKADFDRVPLQNQKHKMEDGGPVIVDIVLQWCKFAINQIILTQMNWSKPAFSSQHRVRLIWKFGTLTS